jgi:hypothetical protein
MTYKDIQENYQKLYGSSVKSCWIADVKRELGLTTRFAYNRINTESPMHPCPNGLVKTRLEKIIME